VRSVLREERGVLPIPTMSSFCASVRSPVRAGYAGGLFHPTTGYSLPVALRFASYIASVPARLALGPQYQRMMAEHGRQFRFCLWLNRLLFGAFAGQQRHSVLERFYRLPTATIRRFYALETRPSDRLRILCGRPPTGFSLHRFIHGGNGP
jgi:lycopene beta-cyclase